VPGSTEALMGAPFTVRLMLIAMKSSPYGVKPDRFVFSFSLPSWARLGCCGFYESAEK
jgi:hypothetical protein